MILTESKFASEAGHWYSRDGASAYECIGNNGQKRNTTLRDARKLGLCPSVTTIIKCAAAPGLERWKQDQVLMAALTLPRRPDEPETDWLARVVTDSKETGRKAADRGTEIHGAIERHFQGRGLPPEMQPHAHGAAKALNDHFGTVSWFAEKSFAHPSGFGGKVDLHCELAVVDFKSKEFDEPKLMAYDEHCMQLAAYRVGLGMSRGRCANVFVSVTKPGLCVVHEWTEDELQKGWRMFSALLDYWKAKNAYEPGWTA